MALSIEERKQWRQQRLKQVQQRGTQRMERVNQRLISRGITPKYDLSTSAGLLGAAEGAGNPVFGEANKIVNPEATLWGRIKSGGGKLLNKGLDLLSRGNYASAGAVRSIVDNDPNTTFWDSAEAGLLGKTKYTYSDVLPMISGRKPKSGIEKWNNATFGFVLDILLDPTTYLTFGVGAGAKVTGQAGVKVLSKTGTKAVQKGLAKGAGQTFGREFVERAVVNMAENNPELYGKFLDQGGMKFFGKTIVSGGRIAEVARRLPMVDKVDEATKTARSTMYALFNRDASAKYGKLPDEFVKVKQKYLDLGNTKAADAIEEIAQIAEANKLNSQEAELITNAIETKTTLADPRLENARKLFERSLGVNLKEELRRGLQVGELSNYVPHILVDNEIKSIPFKPEGVRVSLGASKERTIGKIIREIPEESKPFVDEAKNFENIDEYLAAKADSGKTPEELKEFFELSRTKIGAGENIQQATVREINEAFGKDFFDPNIVNTAANRSVASARATTAADFLREVAQKFGAAEKYAPSNYVSAGAKELKGFKFHPAIAEQIDKFKSGLINDEATNTFLRGFDSIQNLWKASVTSIFPAFHGRNAISNVFLNFLDIGAEALNPANHKLAGELLLMNRRAVNLKKESLGVGERAIAAKKELQELLKTQVIAGGENKTGLTFGELRKLIKDNRVAFGNEYTGFLDIPETMSKKMQRVAESTKKRGVLEKVRPVNPLSQDNLAFRAGRKTGQMVEEQARLVNFMTNLKRTGGDAQLAAARTKQFLFDYSNLSSFEKNVMRRLVPFYTFTRKNLELQAKQLLKQPGKFAGQAKLFNAVSRAFSGGVLTDEEKKNLPQWMQEGLGIVVKRDGDDIEMITSLGTPVEAMFSILKPNAILGSMSPVIAVPLQTAIGKHFFFDKDLKDVNNATAFKNAPQFVKDYIGFTTRKNKDGSDRYIALNPTRMFIVQNIPPSSRVVSVIGQLEEQNVSGKLKLMRQLTGLKPYGKNLSEEAEYREKEKIRALQDLLDKSGVAPIFKNSFIPKAEPKLRRDQVNEE